MESNNSPIISGSPENTDSGSPTPISTNLHSVPSATIPANGGLTTGEPSSRKLVGSSRRKRGRPRKYDALGNLHPSYASSSRISSPPSRAVSPPPGFALTTSFVFQRPRRARDRVSATSSQINWNNQPYYQPVFLGGGIANSERMHFTLQVIMLKAGEDIAAKLFLIGSTGARSVLVFSASGEISSVTVCRPGIAGGVIGYEGRYQLLSLTGSYKTNEVNGVTTTTGGISVSLAGPDGKVVGGRVDGLLISATPIQLVIGTFIPQTAAAIPASPDAMPAEIPILQPVSLGNGVGAPAVPPMPVQTQGEVDDDIIVLEVWGNKSQPPPQERMYPDINVTVPDEE
ncbi:AT-hook motif nuclear-localized protein 1-like [Chenopodium quinoa]|uniref:AT-hook motif nuclear-localized protein 1-like n=1 Tax=Chenopodium quinoa TaxID=63459 RepID=UPI000B77FC81|nr:AT-hook motif nuclear-localized protein 1-like [Chenopodium quinoa]